MITSHKMKSICFSQPSAFRLYISSLPLFYDDLFRICPIRFQKHHFWQSSITHRLHATIAIGENINKKQKRAMLRHAKRPAFCGDALFCSTASGSSKPLRALIRLLRDSSWTASGFRTVSLFLLSLYGPFHGHS